MHEGAAKKEVTPEQVGASLGAAASLIRFLRSDETKTAGAS
jgi:hypothetical protein